MAALVVMGVSGSGKSRVAEGVAERLSLPLIEGDRFHSQRNRALMQRGIALTDAHRADWLERLGEELRRHDRGAVLTCSALKRAYREHLRAAAPGLRFAWLDLDAAAARTRVAKRSEHFFPAGLVDTQFEALEPPLGEAGVLRVDAMLAPEVVVQGIVEWFAQGAGPPQTGAG